MAEIFDKINLLQTEASDYEKICLRIYWYLSYNWNHAPDIAEFRGNFENRDGDIFEIVKIYFKICRKYHVQTFEKLF